MAGQATNAHFARRVVLVQSQQQSAQRVQLDVGRMSEVDHTSASVRLQRERQLARGLTVEHAPDLEGLLECRRLTSVAHLHGRSLTGHRTATIRRDPVGMSTYIAAGPESSFSVDGL